jgi:hypothetical protein
MARRSQDLDYLRAIETLSETEEPLQNAVRQAAPGGEAYDRAPTPAQPKPQKGKLAMFFKRNAPLLGGIAVFGASLFAARKYWQQHR